METILTKFQNFSPTYTFCVMSAVALFLYSVPASGAGEEIPWECTGFVGEAQLRCTQTFTELQQEKIAKLERDLTIQQQTVLQLQQQVAQQASANAKLERNLSRTRSRWYNSPSWFFNPPFGLSLRFGRGKFRGGSLFYGAPYFYGPRWYGPGFRRW